MWDLIVAAQGCFLQIGFMYMAKPRLAAGRSQINYSLVVSSGFLLAVPGRGRETAERRWKGRLFTAESP